MIAQLCADPAAVWGVPGWPLDGCAGGEVATFISFFWSCVKVNTTQ